ncbi:hypothetical protein M0812_14238 [Anaeramoeba flamelloides]|uniref:Uncharacterized protein n=1 Tax=Anaeramoeba flamelloides TaxID=1746091 RepID=A0AAV7ZH49_9EUKA|nr:hypothetical protein M0812_14238 [Anaeramoeba flamelloides]
MNSQVQKSNRKTIGIFSYHANTLRSLELIFTDEELQNNEFIFYVPKSAFNRTKIFQKRWVWYSPPNFYTSQSDILAILVHFGGFKCDQKSLQLFGLLASFRWTEYVPQYYDMKRKNGIRSRQSQNPEGKCVYVTQVTLDTDGSIKPKSFKNGKDSDPYKNNLKIPQKNDNCLPVEDENDLIFSQKPRTRSLVKKKNKQNQTIKFPYFGTENKNKRISFSTREKEKKNLKIKSTFRLYQPHKTSFNMFFPKKKNFNQILAINAQIQNKLQSPLNSSQKDGLKFTYLHQNKIRKIRTNSHTNTSYIPERTNLKPNNRNLFALSFINSDFRNLPFIGLNEKKSQKPIELLPFSNDNQNLQPLKNNRKNILVNKKTSRKKSVQKLQPQTIKHNNLEYFHSRVFSFSNDPCFTYNLLYFYKYSLGRKFDLRQKFLKYVLYLETKLKRYELSYIKTNRFRLVQIKKPYNFDKKRLIRDLNVPMVNNIVEININLKWEDIQWLCERVSFGIETIFPLRFFWLERYDGCF